MIDWPTLSTLLDAVIVFTVVECLVLSVYHRRTGKGVAPRDFAVNLVSGLCLMLALRAGVHAAGAVWILCFLLLAGLAHGGDIGLRWRQQRRGSLS